MALPLRGDFSFITDASTRFMFQSAFAAVETVPGGWNALLPQARVGVIDEHVVLNPVLRQVEDAIHANYGGHSGPSWNTTMQQMRGIARLGWDQYVQVMINREQPQPAAAGGGGGARITMEFCVPSLYDNIPSVCAICFENHDGTSMAINNGNFNHPVRCGHIYHRNCIDGWIQSGKNSCPTCRGYIFSLCPLRRIPPPLEAVPVLLPVPIQAAVAGVDPVLLQEAVAEVDPVLLQAAVAEVDPVLPRPPMEDEPPQKKRRVGDPPPPPGGKRKRKTRKQKTKKAKNNFRRKTRR